MMREYGISFDYIEGNWTDRQFVLMINRMEDRLLQRQAANDRANGIQRFQVDVN